MANNQNAVDTVIASEAIKQVESLISKLSLADAELIKVSESALKASKGIVGISTPSGMDKAVSSTSALNAELTKQNTIISGLQNQIMQLSRAKQAATTQSNSLGNAINSTNKASRESAIANQIARAETDRNFKANTLLAGAYARASAQLLILKKEAKDAAIAYGENSTKAVAASKAANDLGSRIKSADQAVGDYQRNVGNYGNGIAGAFKGAFSSIRQLAYILPGIGLAGIFNLAFEAIGGLIEKMDLFKKKTDEITLSAETLNKAFEEGSVKEATKNVEELTINVGLAKDGFLSKEQVVKQYNETMGKTTGLVSTLNEVENKLVKDGDAYVKMTLYKAAANLALEEAAKQSLEAEKTRATSLTEFSSFLENISLEGEAAATSVATDKKATNDIIKDRKKRREEVAKISEDSAKENIDIAKKFQTNAAKIAQGFGGNLYGDTKAEKVKKEKPEDPLKAIYDANKKEIELQILKQETILNGQYTSYKDQYDALQKANALKLMLIQLDYNEQVRLAKGNSAKIKSADADRQMAMIKNQQDWSNKLTNIRKKENDDYIEELKSVDKLIKDSHDKQDVAEQASFDLKEKIRKAEWDLIDANIKKQEESLKKQKDYLAGFYKDFVKNTGFDETFKILNNEIDGFGKNFKTTFVAIAESAQEVFGFINQNSDSNFTAEKDRLTSQKDIAIKYAGDSAAAKAKIEEDFNKKQKDIEYRQAKQKQQQAIFNIAIDTAQAIMSTLGEAGFAGIPLSVIVGAMGAAQIAMVASQKIPQYFDGGVHGGGLAMINDAGGSNYIETVVTPDGKAQQFKGRDVVTDLPKGTEIFTPEQWREKQLQSMLNEKGISMSKNYQNNGMTAAEMDMVMSKHFAKIQTNHTTFDKNGIRSWSEKNGNKTIRNNARGAGKGFSV
jgi:hypothetical protein